MSVVIPTQDGPGVGGDRVVASTGALLLAAAALAGCTGPGRAAPYTDQATAELAQALTFVESADDGTHRPIDPYRQLPEVDYRSRLTITPDPEALRKIAGSTVDVLPPLSIEEKERLIFLREVADLSKQLGLLAVDLDQKLDELAHARLSGRRWPARPEEESAAVAALVKREHLVRQQLLERIDAAARVALERELDPAAKDFDAQVAARTGQFRQDDQGRPVVLNVRRVRDLLEDRIRELEQTILRDAARLDGESTSLRMRAVLHTSGKVVPVHIENYDSIDLDWAMKKPRVGFGSGDDQDRMKRQVDAITALLELRHGEPEGRIDARSLVDGLGGELREDLDQLSDAFRDVRPEGGPQDLAALVALAREGASDAEQQSLDGLIGYVDDLTRLATASRPANLRTDEFPRFIAEVLALLERAQAVDPAAAMRLLEERLRARGVDVDTALGGMRSALQDQPRDLDRLRLVAATTSARLIALPIVAAAATIDSRAVPKATHPLVPGEIDLNATIANRGDQLEVIAELLRRRGDEEEVFPTVRRTFPVDRFRLVNSLSADVAFVRQTGEDHFRPAPAAAWTLHYRLPDEPDDNWAINFWQTLDPGAGLSVSALSTDSESFQAGIGPHLSLFRDIVRGGWGYNLSADSNRGYVFVSIGIFESIQGIGTLMTGRFGSAPMSGGK